MDHPPEHPYRCPAPRHMCYLNGNYEIVMHDSVPRNTAGLIFKTLPFQRIINQVFPMMYIDFEPIMAIVGTVNVRNHIGARFYLSLSDVQRISNSKRATIFQIRIGEKLSGMSELSEEIPQPLIVWINYKEIPMDDLKSPLNVNVTDYLHLNTVNANEITIYWPQCNRTFYIVANLVDMIDVEEVVQDIKMDNDRYFLALDTKKTIMELFENSGKDAGLVAQKLTLLCPISKSIMKLPAKSVKCNHLQCFDLQAFISLNKIKNTWMCPICMKSCILADLKIDSFLSFIINSINLPTTCVEIELDANGKWKPCILNSGSREGVLSTSYVPLENAFLEIDLGNSDNENLGNSVKTVLPTTSAGNSNDLNPNIFTNPTSETNTGRNQIIGSIKIVEIR